MNEKLILCWLVILSALILLILIYLLFVYNININIEAGNYTLDVGDNLLKVYNSSGEVI